MTGRRMIAVSLIALLALSTAACSSDPAPPRDLLLDSDDFPGESVTETTRETGETGLDEPAVQVELVAPRFTILETLALFESEELALAVLSDIKQDQVAQGVVSFIVDGFDDNSGVMSGQLHGDAASTVFFVEGRALVRITLSGDHQDENIWEIARLAREKSTS